MRYFTLDRDEIVRSDLNDRDGSEKMSGADRCMLMETV